MESISFQQTRVDEAYARRRVPTRIQHDYDPVAVPEHIISVYDDPVDILEISKKGLTKLNRVPYEESGFGQDSLAGVPSSPDAPDTPDAPTGTIGAPTPHEVRQAVKSYQAFAVKAKGDTSQHDMAG